MNLEAVWNTYIRIPLPWVSTLGPEYWATQKVGDKHGPDKYRKLQPESFDLLNAIMDVAVTKDYILDVGSGTGRHMRALRRWGCGYLMGIDVRRNGTFENCLTVMSDGACDIVFTFGMTIELVPPSFPICHHMARIAKKAVVLMVFERGCPYPRLWKQEFEREGLTLTTYAPHGQMGLFVFERR